MRKLIFLQKDKNSCDRKRILNEKIFKRKKIQKIQKELIIKENLKKRWRYSKMMILKKKKKKNPLFLVEDTRLYALPCRSV